MTEETRRPQPERPAAPPKPLQSLALDGLPGLEVGAACDIDDPDCDPLAGRPPAAEDRRETGSDGATPASPR